MEHGGHETAATDLKVSAVTSSNGRPPGPTTCAWVESPLQLLSVIEAHAAGRLGARTRVVPRGGVAALLPTMTQLANLDLPAGLTMNTGSASHGAARPRDGSRWVIGDAFSGRVQRELALDASGELVVVDDGRATLHLLDLLVGTAGRALVRSRAQARPARRLLGTVAGARLRRAAQGGRMTVVTAYDVDGELRERLEALGVRLRRHRFTWLRAQPLPTSPSQRTVVLGSAMVHDGLLLRRPYLDWVADQSQGGEVAYYPHRREQADTLEALRDVPGVRVYAPAVPAELSLRGLDARHQVVCLPSTTATTLRAVLAGRGTRLVVDKVPDAWWTATTSAAVRRHLGGEELCGVVAA